MIRKTTIALALAAGALLSGVITAEIAMVFGHVLFAQGGRIEVPAVVRDDGCKTGVIQSDTAIKQARQGSGVSRDCDAKPPSGRTDCHLFEFAVPRKVLVRRGVTAPRAADPERRQGPRLPGSPFEA